MMVHGGARVVHLHGGKEFLLELKVLLELKTCFFGLLKLNRVETVGGEGNQV